MELLQQHKKLYDGNHGRLCDDYLYFLSNKFPSWVPVECLNALSADDEDAVCSRLQKIKDEYMVKYNKTDLIYGRAAIPLEENFVSECNLGYEKDFQTKEGVRPCVIIGMWPADIGRQYWRLKDKINCGFFNKRFQSSDINSKTTEIRIIPYVKLSHFHRGIIRLKMKDADNNNIHDWLDFADKITGRKKLDSWDSLKEVILKNKDFFDGITINNFLCEFTNKFEGKKTYADVSCGFEVKAYIPFDEAQKLDHDEVFVNFLNSYIKTIISSMITDDKNAVN